MFKQLLSSALLLCFSFSLLAAESSKSKGLVFLMHGCSQTDEEFSKATELEVRLRQEGYEVAYIKKQFLNLYYNCWQWFYEESFNPDSRMMKSYFHEIHETQKKLGIAPEQTYLVGFSSGAGMALNIAMCSQNLIGGIAIHAGVGFAHVRTGTDGLDFMRNPYDSRFKKNLSPCDPKNYRGHMLVTHGEADTVVNPQHATLIMEDLGATKKKCDNVLTDPDGTFWQKGTQKLQQILYPKLGHEWGGGNPAYKYTKKDAPSITDAIIRFFNSL